MRLPNTLSVLAAGLILALGCACGSDSLSTSTPTSSSPAVSVTTDPALAKALPKKVAAAKKIVIGTDPSYSPNEFLAADGKTVQGFDVDLFKAVGQKFGVAVEFVPAKFDGIIGGVSSGKYDIGVSSFTINADRKKEVTMVSYFAAGTQWATLKGNPKNISPDTACGLTVAVQIGTVQQEEDLPKRQKACAAANKPEIKILPFEGQDEATSAVVSKKADGMLADSPVGAYAVKQSAGALMTVGDIYDSAPYGYVLPKDQTEFGAALVLALTSLKTSGDYDRILDGWGVKDGGLTAFAINP